MARVATAGELSKFRSDGQHSRLALSIRKPSTVFACRVNQAFSADDAHNKVAQVTYDGVTTGAYTDAIAGMTVFVGTSAGAYDVGLCRVRKAPTDNILYIGEGSEIEWEDDLYLTVIDEWSIWPRHILINSAGTIYMDYDVAYSAQHANRNPIPVLGPDVALMLLGDPTKELISNGDFSDGTENWTAGGGALLSETGGELEIDQNSAGDEENHCSQAVTVHQHEVYTLSVDVVAYTHGYDILVDGVALLDESEGTGVVSVDFIAANGSATLVLRATGDNAATLTVDDISIKAKGEVAYQPDASNSWVPGGTISGYAWTAATASSITGDTTATPTIYFDAAGDYLISCEVTGSLSAAATGYRWVSVYDGDNLPVTQFALEGNPTGDFEAGGWTYRVRLYDEATIADVRDRAQVILFSRDWYNGLEESMGPIGGAEQVIVVGWIAGESIVVNSDRSEIEFEVRGPNYWIGQIPGFPSGIEDTNFADNGGGAPNRWTEMQSLTVDKGLWHFVYWRTTAWQCMDVFASGDTRSLAVIQAAQGSLWNQLLQFLTATILARPICDRYGRLYCEIDSQYMAEADRSGIPIVMALTKYDIIAPFEIARQPTSRAAMVEASGTAWSGGIVTPLGGVSPGDVFARFGDVDRGNTNLAFSSQAQALTIAGLIAGNRNNEYPSIELALAMNNRLIDVAPRQYVTLTLVAGDTERGVSFTDKKFIPRSVELSYNEAGVCAVGLELEGETFAWPAVKMIFPGSPDGPPKPGDGDEPEPPPPPDPPEPPDTTTGSDTDVVVSTQSEVRTTADFNEESPTWADKTGSFGSSLIDTAYAGDNVMYAITSAAIWKTSDLNEATPTWTAVWIAANDWDVGLGDTPQLLRIVSTSGYVYALAYSAQGGGDATAYLLRSNNDGTTFSTHLIETVEDAYYDMYHDYYSTNITIGEGNNQKFGKIVPITRRTGRIWCMAYQMPSADPETTPFTPWSRPCNEHRETSAIWTTNGGYPAGGEDTFIHLSNTGLPAKGETRWIVRYNDYGLDSAEESELYTFLETLFGTSDYIWTGLGAVDQSMEADLNDRVNVGLAIESNLWAGTTHLLGLYIVWGDEDSTVLNVPKAMAASGGVVYVGLTDKIVVSRDAGVTWADYVDSMGAYDIHIPAYNNPSKRNIIFWSIAGGLYWTTGYSDDSVVLGDVIGADASPVNRPYRIASDPDDGYPLFTIYGTGHVKKIDGVTSYELVSDVYDGRGIRLYKGSDGRRLMYLDSSSIQYSPDGDDGENWTDQIGDWSGYGSPIRIEATE